MANFGISLHLTSNLICDLFPRMQQECENEIQHLEEKKRPLITEKDETTRKILRLEDLLKTAIAEVNRIQSNACDETISDLERQVRRWY